MRSLPKLPFLRSIAAVTALWILSPAAAVASDGVLEINQSCAAIGCFSGDSAGFPVMITASGSYRLTSNLTIADASTIAISVTTSDVSVDLNGFSIRGPVTCAGSPLSCTPSTGTGGGVRANTTLQRAIAVGNGTIMGMGGRAVEIGVDSIATNVRARWNLQGGIYANAGSVVSGCAAYQNLGAGIQGESGSVISGNASNGNATFGIASGYGGTITGNAAYDNGGDGISASAGSVVSNNSAYSNGGSGIIAYAGAMLQSNTARSNTGFGLSLNTQASYRENSISNNSGGTVSGGLNLGNNACNGITTCP